MKFGADDYITKPFNIKIVLKRIGVILNRGNRNQENTFKIRDLIIDFDNRMIKKNNNIIYLTPTEFDLLNIFIKNKNILTLNISRLRSKLDDKNDKYIKTIYGIGYKFLEE